MREFKLPERSAAAEANGNAAATAAAAAKSTTAKLIETMPQAADQCALVSMQL